jgi:alkanesulfonate monooxygenase SsuD/methylene tetrahydromethanopterin reductase-like flavin-dependent oxidoreductase (luciferase family)
LQEGGIPLWIAGGGEKKTLRIAAKYAAYTNFAGSPDEFRHKSEVLAAHCKDVGTDFGAITRSANYNVLIGETEKDVADRLAWLRSHYERLLPAEVAEQRMRMMEAGALSGTPEQVTERLTEMAGHGLGYTIVNFAEAAYDRSGIDLFTSQVVPNL